MGYEGNDRRYGRDQQGYGRSYGQDRDRSGGTYGRSSESYGRGRDERSDLGRYDQQRSDQRSGGYGRPPQGYDYEDRGFFDRAGDEVRSWFGDEEAERRREFDERYREREEAREYGSGQSRGYAPTSQYGGSGQSWGRYSAGNAADYGAGRGAGATGSWGLGAGRDREDWGHDPNYRSWRDRQIESLDRDYADYRREHQSKFDTEFSGWRQTRQGQRDSLSKVREHQEVVGSDGQHVGTVDKVRGDRIILTKNDQDASGHHHSIPCSWVQSVDDKVTINKSADDAQRHWRDEEQRSAFGNDRDGETGGKNLNRSFSGTY